MTVNDLLEGVVEGLTMKNFHASQVQTVEVPVLKVPNWVKFALVAVVISLVVLGISHYVKLAENKKRRAEIERLRLVNAEIAASKTTAEDKLDYYGLKG